MTELLLSAIWVWSTVVAAFIFLNLFASAASKKQLYEIISSQTVEINRLPEIAELLFEKIFGSRHFSIRCILSSFGVSLIAIFLLYVLRIILQLNFHGGNAAANQYLTFVWVQLSYPFRDVSRVSFALAVAGNLLFDYLTLLKTRLLIKALTRTNLSLLVGLLFVAFDFVFSLVLFESFYLLLFVAGSLPIFGVNFLPPASDPFGLRPTIEVMILLHLLTLPGYRQSTFFNFVTHSHAISVILLVTLAPITLTGVFFDASIMPSVWLWLFVFAVATSRAIAPIYPSAFCTLDFEQNPIRTLGFVLATLLSVLWLVFSAIFARL